MVRSKKIILNLSYLVLILALLLSSDVYGKMEVSYGIGVPEGVMNWSANLFWSYQPYENRIINPEIIFNESFASNNLKHNNGRISMLTTSAYVLGHYDLRFGRSGLSLNISAGPGIHILSSLASPGSPAMSASNTEVALKAHIVSGLRYSIFNKQFVSISMRSTFPNKSPIDCGYINYGRILDNTARVSSENGEIFGITRFGINSAKDNYTIFSASGIAGKQIGDNLSIGFGIGWDCAKNVMAVPFFCDFRLYFREFGKSIYAIADGGYSIGWIQGDKDLSMDGPVAFIGAGYSICYLGNNALNFELGVKFEELSESVTRNEYDYNNYPRPVPVTYELNKRYSDLITMGVAQIGFQFAL
jgi:hypothetical protein